MSRGERNVKIYLASKLKYSDVAKRLILELPWVTWTNRWQFFEGEIPDTEIHARNFWENDFDDVDAADAVIVFGLHDDNLRGALVEAGYAIAKGKAVYCAGDNDGFGTWQHSPRVDNTSVYPNYIDPFKCIEITAKAARQALQEGEE